MRGVMKNKPSSHRPNVNALLGIIDRASSANRHDPGTFRLMVEAWEHCLRRYSPGHEEQYLEVAKRLQPAALQIASEGLGLLFQHFVVEQHYEDLLGPVYMLVGSTWTKAGLGQYFTPWEVCQAMAQMALHDLDLETNPSPLACDPCCGSGAMLLAARSAAAEAHGRKAAAKMRLYGYDNDALCTSMCRVQILLTDDDYMCDYLVVPCATLTE